MKPIGLVPRLATLLLLALNLAAQNQQPSADSLLAPFSTREEVENFLRTAKIIGSRGTSRGITNPDRLTLDDGRVRHDAIFKSIDERKLGVTKLERSSEFDFKDSWKFEVAAYEIDKLLGLNMVPVTVEREYRGSNGSLQYWVEGCMLEKDRLDKKLMPPNLVRWNWQIHKIRVFDKLVYNIDRNLGNILVTSDWRCVMIDHSRSFKSLGELNPTGGELQIFSRSMMEALEKLDDAGLQAKCGEYLTIPEIQTTLQRKALILQLYQKLVKEKGNSIVYP
jgi:hypothetical protein